MLFDFVQQKQDNVKADGTTDKTKNCAGQKNYQYQNGYLNSKHTVSKVMSEDTLSTQ